MLDIKSDTPGCTLSNSSVDLSPCWMAIVSKSLDIGALCGSDRSDLSIALLVPFDRSERIATLKVASVT